MRNENLTLRLKDEEKVVMQRVAKDGGYKGISDMIRKLVSVEAERVSEQCGVDIATLSKYKDGRAFIDALDTGSCHQEDFTLTEYLPAKELKEDGVCPYGVYEEYECNGEKFTVFTFAGVAYSMTAQEACTVVTDCGSIEEAIEKLSEYYDYCVESI